MFTGIIEGKGHLVSTQKEGTNLHITFECPFTHELKIDQSLAHNGVCLTVVGIEGKTYTVTAIEETLQRTNLGELKMGDEVNLERCLLVGARLDGHYVQGHVDTTAVCTRIEDLNGSWKYSFTYQEDERFMTVPKGSICVNGVSLTVVDSGKGFFSVCIIPYTFEHTNFCKLSEGDRVNIEFDILGKYMIEIAKRS